jgi:hypothetical protein
MPTLTRSALPFWRKILGDQFGYLRIISNRYFITADYLVAQLRVSILAMKRRGWIFFRGDASTLAFGGITAIGKSNRIRAPSTGA